MEITAKDLLMKTFLYTHRQLDILYADQDKLDRQPSKLELRRLVDLCNKLYDSDALSILNEKYDLSEIFDDDEMEPVTLEQRKKAEENFIAFMQRVHPDFEMPTPIPTDKKKDG